MFKALLNAFRIDVDDESAEKYNVILNNFGIERDTYDKDSLEVLFDINSKTGKGIPCDFEVVCNLYAGERKIATEDESIWKDAFRKRDSKSIYFMKKNVSVSTTRIELFCRKM